MKGRRPLGQRTLVRPRRQNAVTLRLRRLILAGGSILFAIAVAAAALAGCTTLRLDGRIKGEIGITGKTGLVMSLVFLKKDDGYAAVWRPRDSFPRLPPGPYAIDVFLRGELFPRRIFFTVPDEGPWFLVIDTNDLPPPQSPMHWARRGS